MGLTPVTMPQLGESVTEGTVERWLKREGDLIQRDEPLVEVVTDKVNAEIPSPYQGRLVRINIPEGQTVPVGAQIAEMEVPDSSPEPEPAPPAANHDTESFPTLAVVEEPSATSPESWDVAEAQPTPSPATEVAPEADTRYSPVVRHLAEEHGLDLTQVHGTGEGGRVTRDDVLAHLAAGTPTAQPAAPEVPPPAATELEPTALQPGSSLSSPYEQPFSPFEGPGSQPEPELAPSPEASLGPEPPNAAETQGAAEPEAEPVPATVAAAPTPPPGEVEATSPAENLAAPVEPFEAFARSAPFSPPLLPLAAEGREELVPLTAMRRSIAEHMVRSLSTAPHAWTMQEVDVTELVRLRESHKDEFTARTGATLTYLPLIIPVLCSALKQFPQLNSSWTDEGILVKRYYNIGLAVALEEGLIVPVIKDADRLSIDQLALAVRDLAERARKGSLGPDDVHGGTFTLNNTGATGSVISQPIINQPQAAILTTEAIVRRPAVIGEGIAIRHVMNICLSFDHRITDGRTAGQFLTWIKTMLESPATFEGAL